MKIHDKLLILLLYGRVSKQSERNDNRNNKKPLWWIKRSLVSSHGTCTATITKQHQQRKASKINTKSESCGWCGFKKLTKNKTENYISIPECPLVPVCLWTFQFNHLPSASGFTLKFLVKKFKLDSNNNYVYCVNDGQRISNQKYIYIWKKKEQRNAIKEFEIRWVV